MSLRPLRLNRANGSRRSAFSLVEAMVAMAITALAVAALATVTTSSLLTTNDAVARTIADGIAQQMLDEMMLEMYAVDAAGAYSSLGPNPTEQAGTGRTLYNDSDDFEGFSKSPPQGIYGEELGRGNDAGGSRDPAFAIPSGYFGKFRQRFRVYYVLPSDLTTESTNSATSYRCCEAIVEQLRSDGAWVPLATRRRLVSYVPPNL